MSFLKLMAIRFSVACLLIAFFAIFQQQTVVAKGDRSIVKKAFSSATRQQTRLWQLVSEEMLTKHNRRLIVPQRYEVYQLNSLALKQVLAAAPLEFSEAARKETVILEVPHPDGKIIRFRLEESPIFSPEIAKQFSDWKTYQGYGLDDPTATARFDLTPNGFHAQILSSNGTFLIDPYQEKDDENYVVYYKRDVESRRDSFHCNLDEQVSQEKAGAAPFNESSAFANGAQIRTYRLAIATTAQYTTYFRQPGDTDEAAQERALNQVVIVVNRLNGIYRRDFAVSFVLVSGTNVIYTASPEAPSDYGNNGSSSDLTANQTNLDSLVGPANYDVGHLFETGSGGVANLGAVCRTNSKARGLSGLPVPEGDPFSVDYVAHELGHQFAGNHTFNASSNCGSRPASTAYEPGSAVSIMGYAGICNSIANLQRNSIDSFHIVNLTETINFITTGSGSTCGTLSGTNAIPILAPLTSYTIPYRTPFALTANATDADGDALTYDWQDYNLGTASNYPNQPDDDDTTLVARPLFRPYSPVASPSRFFPSLTYILNNSNEPPLTYTGTSPVGAFCANNATCITGEDLPSIARTMNFRVAVRDGRGGMVDGGMTLTVVNTGTPFRVTTQNSLETPPTVWEVGTQQNVTWDVSGTSVSPIDVANVRITLSTDGGQTFPFVLLESTPNDGLETIVVPAQLTAQARIKVEAVNNVFFDVNDVNFTIQQSPTTAYADLGGRVVTSGGTPLRNATVNLLNINTNAVLTARTNARGVYRFSNVLINQSYVITVIRQAYTFTPPQIVFDHTGERNDLNFVAVPIS
jgi:hypothetical protein